MNYTENKYLISPHIDRIPRFSKPLKLGVLASGKGSNFKALVEASRNSYLDADISLLVVNNPECEAIRRAEELNIPCKCLDHRNFSSRELYEIELLKILKPFALEGLVMAGWMRIVTSTLIEEYPNRIINIHPSLLPSFKGTDSINQAIRAGVKITGCTVHLVRQDIDSGPILIQASIPILEKDTKKSLLARIQVEEHKILPLGVAIAGKYWRELRVE